MDAALLAADPGLAPVLEKVKQSRNRAKGMRDRFESLNPEQREVIEMLYFSGLSQQEISDRLHKPLSTVKARIHRGMVRLRKIVGCEI
jgi:RNA polymerase sigma-70 factor (ECF subfamily)